VERIGGNRGRIVGRLHPVASGERVTDGFEFPTAATRCLSIVLTRASAVERGNERAQEKNHGHTYHKGSDLGVFQLTCPLVLRLEYLML